MSRHIRFKGRDIGGKKDRERDRKKRERARATQTQRHTDTETQIQKPQSHSHTQIHKPTYRHTDMQAHKRSEREKKNKRTAIITQGKTKMITITMIGQK